MLKQHASPEKVAEYKKVHGHTDHRAKKFSVARENWNTVKVFCSFSTQWDRVGSVGIFSRLRYEALPTELAMSGRTLSKREYRCLKVMEAVAKPIINEAVIEAVNRK